MEQRVYRKAKVRAPKSYPWYPLYNFQTLRIPRGRVPWPPLAVDCEPFESCFCLDGSFRNARYCIDLVEQTYGLPCASEAVTSLTADGEVIVYSGLNIVLNGESTHIKGFC